MPPAAAQVQIKYISSGHGCPYFKDNIRQTICQYIVPKSIKCIYKCLRLCYTFSVQKTVQIQSGAGVDAVCGVPSHKGDRICKKRISSGEYRVGSKIPTEEELSKELRVSRPTVSKALETLVRDGFLKRIRGKGSFVTKPKLVHESTGFITSYRTESEKKGLTLRTEVVRFEVIKAPEDAAAALRLSAAEKVIRLVRLRWLEGHNSGAPVVYTVLYVPFKRFPGMTELDFTYTSFYEALAERGMPVYHSSKKLEVIPADPAVTSMLKSDPFEPVVFITTVSVTDDGMPIEYSESFYPASSSGFLIEIDRAQTAEVSASGCAGLPDKK